MANLKQVFLEHYLMSKGALALLLALALMLVGCQCEVKIKTTSLPTGTVGQRYDFLLQESNKHCSGECEWRVIGGNLPPGLILSNSGRLSGIPTFSGSYSFTVEVVAGDEDDTSGSDSASVGLVLIIN